MSLILLGIGALAALYWYPVRRWFGRWGANRLFGILDRPSANRILPEFQQLSVGDKIHLGPREELTVIACDPYRGLVLGYNAHGFEWVWQFGLYPARREANPIGVARRRFANTVGAWLPARRETTGRSQARGSSESTRGMTWLIRISG